MAVATEWRVPAFAKVNLGLEILGRRADRFHEMVTLYQTVDLHDLLVIRRRPGREIVLTSSDPSLPTDGSNLVARAYRGLARRFPGLPGCEVHIDKHIPTGGGLGGGSSDAAAFLLAMRRFLPPSVSMADLAPLAARLGSDVPFFLVGGLALGLGRGEIVVPLPDLPRLWLALVLPEQPISTPAVFARLPERVRRLTPPSGRSNIFRFLLERQGTGAGLDRLRNDLAVAARPMILGYDRYMRSLRGSGALLASLSGSGSAIYGLFTSARAARHAAGALGSVRTHVSRTVDRGEYSGRHGVGTSTNPSPNGKKRA